MISAIKGTGTALLDVGAGVDVADAEFGEGAGVGSAVIIDMVIGFGPFDAEVMLEDGLEVG